MNRLKVLIIVLTLFLVILVAGCSEPETNILSGAAVSEIKTPATQSSDYKQELTCKDECNEDTCDLLNFVKCDKKADGCKYKSNTGLTLGKCGIQCLSSADCGSNGKCNINYECEKVKVVNVQKVCEPYERICDGKRLLQCNLNGTKLEKIEMCKGSCSEGKCTINYGEQSSMLDSLKDLKDELESTSRVLKKVEDCSLIYAGSSANIPAIKNEFYSMCYQIYYYSGESGLDDFVKDYQS